MSSLIQSAIRTTISMKGSIVTSTTKPGTEVEVPADLPPELVARFAEMATLIPVGGEDAVQNIVSQVLGATSWEDLSSPWETKGVEYLRDRALTIVSVERLQSDYRDSLGIFLVIHAVDQETGEQVVFASGAVSVVAQLVRAFAGGWLPIHARLIVADRPTKDGYYPHHLKFTGRSAAAGS